MLRDKSLIPLSQQHHNALALCVLTERSLREDDSAENIARLARRSIDRYELELSNHFEIEERTLFPVIESELGRVPMIAELTAEHRRLEQVIDAMRRTPSAALLLEFSGLLRKHIRREETGLFEEIQKRLPPEILELLGDKIDSQVIRICL